MVACVYSVILSIAKNLDLTLRFFVPALLRMTSVIDMTWIGPGLSDEKEVRRFMGERDRDSLQHRFDRRVHPEFHGSTILFHARPLACPSAICGWIWVKTG